MSQIKLLMDALEKELAVEFGEVQPQKRAEASCEAA